MTEIANAYVALTVKAPNAKKNIESELGQVDSDGAGKKIGDGLGQGISSKQAAIAGAVGGIVASVASVAFNAIGGMIGDAIEQSDATDKFRQTLDFAGLDTTAVEAATSASQKYADQTVYDLATIQRTTAQLAANGIKDYSGLTEAAGNLNAVAGGNADTFKSVAMMMAQTAGAGKLSTENWNQLADAIPGASGPLMKALEEAGAYTGNFRDAMADGQITADEFNDALLKLGNQPVAVEAASSTATLEGALGNLEATITGGLAGAINTMKPMLTGAVDFLSGALGGFFDWFSNSFTGIYEFLVNGNFSQAFKDAFGVSEDSDLVGFLFNVRDAITGLWDLLVNGNFGEALKNAFGWQEDSPMVDMLFTARDAVIGLAESIPEKLGAAFEWVKANWDWLSAIIVGVGGAVLAFQAWQGALLAWQTITKAATAIQVAFNAVMNANPIMLVVTAVAALVAGLVYFFTQTELGKEIWAGFVGFITDVWNGFVNWLMTVVVGIATWWNEIWGGIGQFFTDLWNNIVFGVETAIAVVQSVIEGVLTTISDTWNGIWQGMSDFIASIFEGLVNIVKAPINGIIGLINGIIDAINGVSVEIPEWSPIMPGATLGFNLPKIPELAAGGIVTGSSAGTLALIGEAGRGRDEAVIPLPSDWRSNGLGGSGTQVQVDVHPAPGMDEATVGAIAAREIGWALRGA